MPAVSVPEDFPLSAFTRAPSAPSKATLLRAIHEGELSAVKVGREYRVTSAAYADWERRRRVPAGQLAPELPASVREAIDRLAASAPPMTATQVRAAAGVFVRRLTLGGAAA